MKDLFVRTYKEFQRDGGSQLSAALAYYALFALAPATLFALALATAVVGRTAVDALLQDSLVRLLGPTLANMLIDLSASRSVAYDYQTAWIAIGILFATSALALNQVQAAFDRMWSVCPRSGASLWSIVRARLAQALIALMPAILLLAGVLANSVAAVIASRPVLSRFDGLSQILGSPLAVLVSSAVAFLVIFKYLPDAFVPWRAALPAAALTALAWVVGTYLFGLYVGRAAIASLYGVAGSAFVLLIWLNYSARIVLIGAKVSKVLAERQDGSVRARPYATGVRYQVVEQAEESTKG